MHALNDFCVGSFRRERLGLLGRVDSVGDPNDWLEELGQAGSNGAAGIESRACQNRENLARRLGHLAEIGDNLADPAHEKKEGGPEIKCGLEIPSRWQEAVGANHDIDEIVSHGDHKGKMQRHGHAPEEAAVRRRQGVADSVAAQQEDVEGLDQTKCVADSGKDRGKVGHHKDQSLGDGRSLGFFRFIGLSRVKLEDKGVNNKDLPRPEREENGEQSVEEANESHFSLLVYLELRLRYVWETRCVYSSKCM
mmetsp:Transcript_1970/g.4632  ORF Transcript_1970/g.4632 Transcript_1970/m.4632 type:complete len:251 (-) Transcript_1970:593-1345(-)